MTGNVIDDVIIYLFIIAFLVICIIGLIGIGDTNTLENYDIQKYGSKWNWFKVHVLGLLLTTVYVGFILIITLAATYQVGKIVDYMLIAHPLRPLVSCLVTPITFFGIPVLFGLLTFKTRFFAYFRSLFGSDDNGIPISIEYDNYIEHNKTKLGLFVRPKLNKYNIALANKYCIVEVDLSTAVLSKMKYTITDKQNGLQIIYFLNEKDVSQNKKRELFHNICKIFDYETRLEDIEKIFNQILTMPKREMTKKSGPLYLDINQASEAELTAIPGVTIAKAKHAVKVRKKQVKYLSMNQFYQAINLNEEFIEQIPIKGNKILLNELPEYRQIESN